MTQQSAVLVVLSDESEQAMANQMATLLGYPFAHTVVGTGYNAAQFIEANQLEPRYILMLIGDRKEAVLDELDELAGQCVSGTQLVVAGETNDISFYRALMDRGVLDYFNLPVDIREVTRCMTQSASKQSNQNSTIISFVSAAAGDGSSTVALNTAYSLCKNHNAKTIIIDMDYQFGMTSKNLDLSSPYGIKELFDHPDRGIDSTLIERMVVSYHPNLDIIAAPNELKFQPNVQPEIIRDLLIALKEKYQFIIIDLPHIWSPWIAAAFSHSDAVMLVAQLWLKSVTHASRLLNVWRETGVNLHHTYVTINRSGAKFKEGVTPRDFERVCHKDISYYLPNDIKTVVNAENMGKTIQEVGKTRLGQEICKIADDLSIIKTIQTANMPKLSFQERQQP